MEQPLVSAVAVEFLGPSSSAEDRLRERMMRLAREIDVAQAHLQALDKANEGLRASALPLFGQEIIDE